MDERNVVLTSVHRVMKVEIWANLPGNRFLLTVPFFIFLAMGTAGASSDPSLVLELFDTALENFPSHVVVFVEPIQDDDKPNLKVEGRNGDVFLTTGFRPASISQRFCNEKSLIAPEQNRLRK